MRPAPGAAAPGRADERIEHHLPPELELEQLGVEAGKLVLHDDPYLAGGGFEAGMGGREGERHLAGLDAGDGSLEDAGLSPSTVAAAPLEVIS